MKSSTTWITIPEETFHTPVSTQEPRPKTDKKSASEVKHKFFWGVGFAVVLVVSFAMLAPQQFNTVIQGNLFDAPGVEAPEITQVVQPLGVLSTQSQTLGVQTPALSGAEVANEEIVVQPETSPVSIQVAPLALENPEPVEIPAAAPSPVLDANQRLLQELRQQVGDLRNEQPISVPFVLPSVPGLALPNLTLPLDLRAAAPEAAATTAIFGETSPTGYRLNTHRVTVSPQTVLQQNLSGGQYVTQPQTSQIRVNSPLYQANLSRAQATPDTGPHDVMLVAFILTFIGLLGWKAVKLGRN